MTKLKTEVKQTKILLGLQNGVILKKFKRPPLNPNHRLYAHGGGDMPEMAMTGIQLAIENCRPGSTIYVITDASAKDYGKQVRARACVCPSGSR